MYASKGIDLSPNSQSENSDVYGDGMLLQDFSSTVCPPRLQSNNSVVSAGAVSILNVCRGTAAY